jgi:hypothetical protein
MRLKYAARTRAGTAAGHPIDYPLLSMVGFSMETGLAFYMRQTAHAAAESAAMATVLAAMSSVSGSSVTCSGSGTTGTQCSSTAVTCAPRPIARPKPTSTTVVCSRSRMASRWEVQHCDQDHREQYQRGAEQSECGGAVLGAG